MIVNRIWQWHFGTGLVSTPNNFGSRGARPSHPELLDWLASEFVAGGYRLKPLHRLIMLSDAYQRSSAISDRNRRVDPLNRLLGRFSRRRLSAEEIRDSLLFVGGRLDLTVGKSHPFPKEETWKFTQHAPFHAVYETNRRSVFLMVQRQRRHPFLALFDGADPNASTGKRSITTVPTQALYFLNNPFFHSQSEAFAARIVKASEKDANRIRFAFRVAFQREPDAREVEAAVRFLSSNPHSSQAWQAYARVLLASNEFIYID